MSNGVKIECIIKRPKGTRVDFDQWPNANLPDKPEAPAASYHFKPIDPQDPNSPHIAVVENEHHLARFLSIVDGYRLYRGDGDDDVEIPEPPKQTPKAVAPKPAAKPQDTKTSSVPGANPETAIEICNLSVRDLKARIAKYSDVDLRGALAREANSGDAPRKQWREVIEAQLGTGEAV